MIAFNMQITLQYLLRTLGKSTDICNTELNLNNTPISILMMCIKYLS